MIEYIYSCVLLLLDLFSDILFEKTKQNTIEPLNVVTFMYTFFGFFFFYETSYVFYKVNFGLVLIFQEFWEDLFNNASKWGMFMYEQVS